MKLKLLQAIIMLSKCTAYGFVVQVLFFNLLLANTGSAQKTLSVREVHVVLNAGESKVRDVFNQIERNSDFRFAIDKNDLKSELNQKVGIEGGKNTVSDILIKISKESGIKFRQVNNNITVSRLRENKLLGQIDVVFLADQEISGKITDENGQGLPGASIVIKGTSNGTTSDLEGNYKLGVPENSTVIISFVGYVTQEIEVGSQSVIDLQMRVDAGQLDEVIVVGYGTQRRKEVSGAVAQVEGRQLTKAPISTLTNSLTGRLPGLTVNQRSAEPGRESTSILVRGNATFGDNSALIVIDGVANIDGLDRLDPNDIESVTILKDASAAIYGAQAANGVVLVTTKRGKLGTPQFNYSANMGFNSPIGLTKIANGLEYATFVNRQAWMNSGWDPNYTPVIPNNVVEGLKNGTTPTTEWRDAAYKDFFTQTSHNLSVRGGIEKVKYFLSARYLNQGSVFEHDDIGNNKQYNIRSNLDFNLTERLDMGLDISLRQQDVANSATRFAAVLQNSGLTSPLLPKYLDGDMRYPASGRANQNPVPMMKEGGYEKNERRNQNARFTFNYKIPEIEGLAVGGFASIAISTDMSKTFTKPWTYYVPNTTDPNGTPEKRTNGNIRLDQSHNRYRALTSNFRTTYTKSIGEHNIDVLLQLEQQKIRTDEFSAGNDNFLSTSSDQLNSGSSDRGDSFVSGQAFEQARISYSGRVNYNYQQRYMAQFLFRYDGSERFAEGQRFGFFPGGSVAWILSEEGFLRESSIVNNLKLRVSWGQLGNDRIPAFNYLSRFSFGASTVVNGGTVPGITEAGISNPNVTWEVSETTNVGIEAGFFNNKLTLEFDVFDTQTKGILAQPLLTLPQYTGITPPRQNIGQHQNRGFEIATSYRNQVGEVNFQIGGNIAHTKNKILFFDEPPFDESYQNQTGRPLGAGLFYHAIGIFRTQEQLDNLPTRPGDQLGDVIIQDANNDGEITIADRMRLDKTTNPDWVYGITTQIAFKNFDMSMLWQGALGGLKPIRSIFSDGQNGLAYYANNSWAPDNVDAKWPAPRRGEDTDFYQLTANYLRLKTLEIGYNIPESVTNTIGLSNLRVYVSGYNLITFDKNAEIGASDPEQINDLSWDYPNLKTVNMGINVSF